MEVRFDFERHTHTSSQVTRTHRAHIHGNTKFFTPGHERREPSGLWLTKPEKPEQGLFARPFFEKTFG